jgi:CheY-like chemotaxis protein
MPILDGFQATVRVREIEREDCDGAKSTVTTDRESHRLNGRIPIFVVSASLREEQRPQLNEYGLDGWVLKPINFKRLVTLLDGITNTSERTKNLYQPNNDWELGGWLTRSTQAGNTAGDRGSTSSPSGAGSSNASTA